VLWFGDPWSSYVCYDDLGRLRTSQRVPAPVGQTCPGCGTPILDGESGQIHGVYGQDQHGALTARYAPLHKECALRSAVGSLAHLQSRCTCVGGADETITDARAEALRVWAWVQEHGVNPTGT
jgi:hypothetical protein